MGAWRIAVTDPSRAGWLERAAALLRDPSIDYVQLRAHDLPAAAYLNAARQLAAVAADRLIINGPLEVADLCDAHGVHVRSGAPVPATGRRIYAACHDLDAVLDAARRGADVALVSPVFAPRSKPGARPCLGLTGLATIVAASPIPVVALGGMNDAGLEAVTRVGAVGAAGIDWFFGDLSR